MKKWLWGIVGVVAGGLLLIYAILHFAGKGTLQAYEEMSVPVPPVSAPFLNGTAGQVGPELFVGKVTLVSFFASWCGPCHVNHKMLLKLTKEHGVHLVGINLRDKSHEAELWLLENGNPFKFVGSDPQGAMAGAWGVQGIPQIFVVDKKGQIRFRHTGVLTPDRIEQVLLPLIRKLEAE